jgi:hypothetical protein
MEGKEGIDENGQLLVGTAPLVRGGLYTAADNPQVIGMAGTFVEKNLKIRPLTEETWNATYNDGSTNSLNMKIYNAAKKILVAVYFGDENGALMPGYDYTTALTEYQAEEGMTWAEWCDSQYNTDGEFYINHSLLDAVCHYGIDGDNWSLGSLKNGQWFAGDERIISGNTLCCFVPVWD